MRSLAILTVCALMIAGTGPATAARIGVAAGVSNHVTGTVSGQARVLHSGDGVFQNQIVKTEKASSAQLLFIDETSLTVGPNSSVTLDRFVYNPNGKTGEVVLNITRGAFRFVTGSQRSNAYKIKTPVATIGVRGTIIEGFLYSGNLILVLVEGAFEACSMQLCTTVSTPGQFIRINLAGQITSPAAWTGPTLDVRQGINAAFEGNKAIRNLGRFTDPLPNSTGLNDALDSRNTDLRLTPEPTGKVLNESQVNQKLSTDSKIQETSDRFKYYESP